MSKDPIVDKIKKLAHIPSNKICCDCGQPGPTYVNVTVGSFVCMTCSGALRGLIPQHRVKSINMSTFTEQEYQILASNGNLIVNKTLLANMPSYDEKLKSSSSASFRKLYMQKKYEDKVWKITDGQTPADSSTRPKQETSNQTTQIKNSPELPTDLNHTEKPTKRNDVSTDLLEFSMTSGVTDIPVNSNAINSSFNVTANQNLTHAPSNINNPSNSLLGDISDIQFNNTRQPQAMNQINNLFSNTDTSHLRDQPRGVNPFSGANTSDKYSLFSDLHNISTPAANFPQQTYGNNFGSVNPQSAYNNQQGFNNQRGYSNPPQFNVPSNQAVNFQTGFNNPMTQTTNFQQTGTNIPMNQNEYFNTGGNVPLSQTVQAQPDVFALSQGFNGLPQTTVGSNNKVGGNMKNPISIFVAPTSGKPPTNPFVNQENNPDNEQFQDLNSFQPPVSGMAPFATNFPPMQHPYF